MAELELPAVAKTVYLDCKKCGAERYHVVLAHTTSTSAKVKCEVCGSQKTYKLTPPKAAKKTTGPAKPRATRANAAELHRAEYEKLMGGLASQSAQKYSMKLNFAASSKLEHPKFGTGVVRVAQVDKIEVVFADEVRQLVHNRP